jgi:hypothetical protein
MAIEMHSEGARIFQFPLRPRLRLDNGRTMAASPQNVLAALEPCWYHDEAVRERDALDVSPKPL